jgi:hypothetical protein
MIKDIVSHVLKSRDRIAYIHLGLISAGVLSYTIAISLTMYHLYTYPLRYAEMNPVAALSFHYLGLIPTFIVALVLLVIVMINVPYVFREKRLVGVICNVCIVLFFVVDMGNNLYWLFGDMYWLLGDTYRIFLPFKTAMHTMYNMIGVY